MTDIAILHEAQAPDARPDNLDALVQVAEVRAALEARGHRVSIRAIDLDFGNLLDALKQSQPDCVVNLVESLGGSDRLITIVPALLAAAGVPFTGSTAEAISLSTNKLIAKRWMTAHEVATPGWLGSDEVAGADGGSWIVKSVWEHASLGIDEYSVVQGGRATAARLQQRRDVFGGEWFAERFVAGREFNVSVLEIAGEPNVLPIAEINFDGFPTGKPKIVGYAAKWQVDATEYHNTPRVFPALGKDVDTRLRQLARTCWKIFGLGGYARVDIRMDESGTPWVLEVNANPCLSQDAGFAAAAEEAGLGYGQLIETILDAALRPTQSGTIPIVGTARSR
ncbi:MAG TPA: hypothetical protein PKK10_00290 [Woeseiaceae bacterium]|nr:hypothetical protein [Woeseiaceae bacterium]